VIVIAMMGPMSSRAPLAITAIGTALSHVPLDVLTTRWHINHQIDRQHTSDSVKGEAEIKETSRG
jgi:hypothetical protein